MIRPPVATAPSMSLVPIAMLQFLRARFASHQQSFTGLRGRRAIERALRLHHHARNNSTSRSVFLGLLSPTPILLLLIIIDAFFSLSDPQLGPARNIVSFARSTFANAAMALSAELTLLLALGVPIRPSLAWTVAGLALLIGILAEAPWIVAAFVWEYPVPAKYSLVGVSLFIPLAICIFFVMRSPSINHRWACRRRVLRSCFVVVGLRILLSALMVLMASAITSASLWARIILLLIVRVIKIRFQRHLNVSKSCMPKSGVETAAVSGEAMFAMFHLACIQIQESAWLVVVFVAIDAVEVFARSRSMPSPLSKENPLLVWGTMRSFGSAVTATSTSERVEFERASFYDGATLPFPNSKLNGGDHHIQPETVVVRRTTEIGIKISHELSVAHSKVHQSKTAKVYCVDSTKTKFVTRNSVVVRGPALPPRKSAPSLMGNGTRRATPVDESKGSQTYRIGPKSTPIHRCRTRARSRCCINEESAAPTSVKPPPLPGTEPISSKRRGNGETARLRDRIISCEILVLEKFTTLLVVTVFGT